MTSQNMLRELPRLVPWTSWDEWKQVSLCLWSANPYEQDLGLKRVAAWKARGKIPVAIELTVNLLEVIRQDGTASTRAFRKLAGGLSPHEMRSELERRMLYSMALTRMVNGLTAPYQQSYHAKSILDIAQRLYLPDGLVELRHEAAHAEIPSLPKLRSVSLECMQWLYERYWLCQTLHFDQVKTMTIQRCEKLANLRKSLSAENAHQRADFQSNKKEAKTIVSQLTNDLSSNQSLISLVPVLADLLVPRKMQVSQLTRKYKEVPQRLLLMWMDTLTKFTKHWPCFLPALLVTLITKLFEATQLLPEFNPSLPPQKNEEDRKSTRFSISLLKCWYEHLLRNFFEISLQPAQVDAATQSTLPAADETSAPVPVESPPPAPIKKKPTAQTTFKMASALLPYKAILHLCLQHMNKHSVKLIKTTLCYMSDGPERDAILPKLGTLFHFRSRALNLTRAEQAHKHGGSMERALELQRRVDVNTDQFKPREAGTELSLEEFEKLISRRSTPINTPSTSTTPIPSLPLENGTQQRAQTPIADPSSTSATPIPEMGFNEMNHPRSSIWTAADGIYPGIGLNWDGLPPGDLSLPVHLDDYVGAVFLIPIPPTPPGPPFSPQKTRSEVKKEESSDSESLDSYDEWLRRYNSSSGSDHNESDSDDERDSAELVLKEPEPKRRCVPAEEVPQVRPTPTPPPSARVTPVEPAVKVVVEKAKVKLMIAPKKTANKK